jgi:hypothetical protein
MQIISHLMTNITGLYIVKCCFFTVRNNTPRLPSAYLIVSLIIMYVIGLATGIQSLTISVTVCNNVFKKYCVLLPSNKPYCTVQQAEKFYIIYRIINKISIVKQKTY